mmetsp:Transcript_17640/g.49309  ORF Transcript_17640/g.49309 Transcript_17640/m.49309 type:complete len:326 (+) Transcript_17640:78-1055(+)
MMIYSGALTPAATAQGMMQNLLAVRGAQSSRRTAATHRHVCCRATGDATPRILYNSGRRNFISTATLVLAASWGAPRLSSAVPAFLDGEAKQAVEKALEASVPKGKAPAVLRVVFHDAGTYDIHSKDGGANGSVRYELDRPENKGLKRGVNCITDAMSRIKGTPAAGQVSYADMIALAGAHAVALTGGPTISVPIGRVDAGTADPENRLPSELATITELKTNFASKGFSVQEFVALCGSHTIGNKGFGEPLAFDNTYYKTLLRKPWNDPSVEMGSMIGLPSDHVLAEDQECLDIVKVYADQQEMFFQDFTTAFSKLSALGTPLLL